MLIPKNFPKITEYKAKNLSDFMTILNEIDPQKYHFRGESNEFKSLTSSALRKLEGDTFYNHEEMLNQYYRRVANNLSSLEISNFMPYAQHHGLPTPLIDITATPLTALYFATTDVHAKKSFIFLFPKHRCIDVSHFLTDHWDRNLLVDLLNKYEDVIRCFYKNLVTIKACDPKYIYLLFTDLIGKLSELHSYSTYASAKRLNEFQKINSGFPLEEFTEINEWSDSYNPFEDQKTHLNQYFHRWELSEILKKEYHLWLKFLAPKVQIKTRVRHEIDHVILWYLITLQTYLSEIYYYADLWNKNKLPLLPLLTYEPTILFDRLLAQDGLFFYQLNFHTAEPPYESGLILSQEIHPSIIIELTNPHTIKKEIHALGINRLKMFPDHDNIAAYFKELYGYRLR